METNPEPKEIWGSEVYGEGDGMESPGSRISRVAKLGETLQKNRNTTVEPPPKNSYLQLRATFFGPSTER